MIKRILVVLVAVLGVVAVSSGPHIGATQNNLQISPVKQEFAANPGDTKTVQITVANTTAAPLAAHATYTDFLPTNDGTPKLLTDGTKNDAYGLNGWFTGPATFTIPANNKYTYTATIKVPAGTKPGTHYGAVSFTDTATAPDKTTSIGTILLVNVGTPVLKASLANSALKKSSLTDLAHASATFELTVKNEGGFMFTPDMQVTIVDNTGKQIALLKPAENGNVLPQSSRAFDFEWSGSLDKDKSYRAESKITLPDGTVLPSNNVPIMLHTSAAAIKSAQKKNNSHGWLWLLVGGAVGVVLVVLALLLVMRRRKKKRAAPRPIVPVMPRPMPELAGPTPQLFTKPDQTPRAPAPPAWSTPAPAAPTPPAAPPSSPQPTPPTQLPPVPPPQSVPSWQPQGPQVPAPLPPRRYQTPPDPGRPTDTPTRRSF